MIERNVKIGAQLYINRDDTPDMIEHWIKQFYESGLKIVRVFIFWYQVEPSEGIWDFTNYDTVFREAEKYGLSVCATLMAVYPPGWMHITDNYKIVGDLDDQDFWGKSLNYVEKVVKRYYNSPALLSWIVWKEPARFISKNPNSIKGFRRYLRRMYGGEIENLNRIYFNSYANFDEVGHKSPGAENLDPLIHPEIFPDNVKWFLDHPSYPENLDWTRFKIANLCGKISELVTAVRRIDKKHPLHVNPQGMGSNLLHAGQSIWGEAKEVDFLGCSNHPSWHGTRLKSERLHQCVSYYTDMVRSATPDPNGYFWVTELQAGPTTLSGSIYYTPTYSDLTLWLWDCIGSGAAAVLFWLFNIRNSGDEGGEWSLLGQDGEPTFRLHALSDVAKMIADNQSLFDEVRAKKPDIWILCSENSWMLGDIEGRGEDVKSPRNKQLGSDAFCAAYLMASDLGLQVQMVDEEKVISGEIPEDAVLIAPSVISVEDGLCPALERFVKNGGTLIADNMFAFKNKNGYTQKPYQKEVIDRIFGAVMSDIIPDESGFKINTGPLSLNGWFLRLMFKEGLGGEVIGRFDDNSPAIIRHSYGKGVAIRIGTTFFQQYLPNPTDGNLDYLKSLLPGKLFSRGIRLENPSAMLRLKELDSNDKKLLILLNHSESTDALLVSDKAGTLNSLGNGESIAVEANVAVKIKMAKGEAKQFVFLQNDMGEHK